MAATDYPLLAYMLMRDYDELLDWAEMFSLKHPDNIDGYNALISLAEKKLRFCHTLELTNLSPLPPYKTEKDIKK
jgi:hypothetical protein